MKDLSVIIPAYNEECNLPLIVENLREILGKFDADYEIIVSNNNSSDKTREVAESLSCKVVDQPIRNIGATRNAGAKIAEGRWLMFVDADSMISEDLLEDVFVKVGVLNKAGPKPDQRPVTASTISKFNKYPSIASYGVWLYNFFSKIFKFGVGQFILVRRTKFQELNGFDEKYFAFEEIDFFKRLKKECGFSSMYISPKGVTTSSRKFEKGKTDVGKFLLLLLASLLGKEVGKDKRKLEFWYSNSQLKDTQSYLYKKVLVGLILFLFISNTLHVVTESPFLDISPQTVPLVFLLFLPLLIDSMKDFYRLLIFLILTVVVEIIGVKTGFPFGEYFYDSEYAEIGILGVPIFIGGAWYLVASSLTRVTRSLLLTVLFAVLIDIILEEFALINGIWIWLGDAGRLLLVAPIQNYITWGVLAGVGYFLFKNSKQSLLYSVITLVLIVSHVSTNLLVQGVSIGWFGHLICLMIIVFGIRRAIAEL